MFIKAKEVLKKGGYYIIDELENHFNKQIALTLVRLFNDSRINNSGAMLIFSSHYPELLDEFDRTDNIYIVKNKEGISVVNLSELVERNDLKKCEIYKSGILTDTAPSYESIVEFKRMIIKDRE